MNPLGSGQGGETKVPKYRAVLKMLMLLKLWLCPVASPGLIQEGKGFKNELEWFLARGVRWNGREGWTVRPPVSSW